MFLLNNPIEANVTLTIPFHDVDSMKIVWHGNYLRYFEIAREALLTKIGYGYREMEASGYAWPVVDIRAKYKIPLTFEQTIRIQASLMEYEHRLRIRYRIFDIKSEKLTTLGDSVQMAIHIPTHETCFTSPTVLLDCIAAYKG